jgi:hypothetical protein
MICKLLSIPFCLISGCIKLIAKVVGTAMSLGFGTFRLIINRLFSVLFGALIGFFLGKKHIKIKFFTGKKH